MFETVRTHPLLILDDLGTQAATPWAQEKLFQLLNARYNQQLPTILTSNRPLSELDERLRVRVTDPDLSRVCWVQPPRSLVLQRLGTIPPLIANMTFESFEPDRPGLSREQADRLGKAFEAAERFAAKPEGWLMLQGPVGCGKTHLAGAVANRCGGTFITVPELLDHLRSTYGPDSTVTYDEMFETIRTAPLLVLDDLGSQSGTAWAQEKLYQLFNYRYNFNLATVVTTNLPLDALEPRLASRLGVAVVCSVYADDYRWLSTPSRRAARAASPRDSTPRRRPGPSY
jgi:DNA replication protein DnaC